MFRTGRRSQPEDRRSLTLNRVVIAADKYVSVKEFFTKMLNAEQSPVVLIRK
ncbi:MAG: hypothetical protein ABIO91_01215 [Pyrinomonadaceae bacterium]